MLVDCHLPRHEDKTVKHHAGPHNRDVLERLLQDDEKRPVSLGRIRITDPPEVQPVGVDLTTHVRPAGSLNRKEYTARRLAYLMVRNHYHALGKREFHQAVLCLSDLVGNRGIAADTYRGWAPPMGHGSDEQPEGLLGERHVGIVKLAIDPVQGRTEKLSCVNTVMAKCPSLLAFLISEARVAGECECVRNGAGEEVENNRHGPKDLNRLAVLLTTGRVGS